MLKRQEADPPGAVNDDRNGSGTGTYRDRHVREKATIDHLAQNFDKPKPHGEKNTLRSPTTATGLSVEDRVRKEWYPSQRWPPHVLNKSRCLQPLRGNDGTSATSEASAGSRCGHGRSRHRRDHA